MARKQSLTVVKTNGDVDTFADDVASFSVDAPLVSTGVVRSVKGPTEEDKTARTTTTTLDPDVEISVISNGDPGHGSVNFVVPNPVSNRSGQRKIVRSSLFNSNNGDCVVSFDTDAEEAGVPYNTVTFPVAVNTGMGHWIELEWANAAEGSRGGPGWVIIAYSPGLIWNVDS